MKSSSRRGFTLIEVIVAAFLVTLGVASLVGVLGTLSQAQRRMVDREQLERLAETKIDELAATREYESVTEGNFSDQGLPDFTWSAESEATGIENLYELRVTVSKSGSENNYTVQTLKFVPPEQTGTTGA